MAKRADWQYIKTLKKIYGKALPPLHELPLLIIEPGDLYDKSMDLKNPDGNPEYNDAVFNFPVNDFMLLDKTILVQEYERSGTFDFNYFRFELFEDGNFFSITYFTLNRGIARLTVDHTSKVNLYLDDEENTPPEQKNAIITFMEVLASKLFKFMIAIYQVDLYPIERKGTHKSKLHIKHDKKPWARGDLSSIIFLNQLPVHYDSEAKGGHHASPRYHPRKGHNRILKAERYKDNPNYLKPIYIRPMWVGVKTAVVNGVTYKVLQNESPNSENK